MFSSFIQKVKKIIAAEKEENILINILTRTSGRPIGFKKCYYSIKKQSFTNIRHIVSFDNDKDLIYLNRCKVDIIKVEPLKISPQLNSECHTSEYKAYNLYCNELLNQVNEGWIMFLDDDDQLKNRNVLRTISEIIKGKEDCIFFWHTQFPNGFLIPSKENLIKRKIVYQQMDTACFIFHSKYKKAAQWDCWKGADYRFITKLVQVIPRQEWLPEIITQKNNFGDNGRRNDIGR